MIRRFRLLRGMMAAALLSMLAPAAPAWADDNGQITDPTSNSSVTVGQGSAKLGVKFTLTSGFYPTSAKLIIPDGMKP
jgi:hypothetical protein